MIACVVASHFHLALHALADVDDDFTVARAFFQRIQQPGVLRGITGAEGSHDDGSQVRRVDDVTYQVFANSREEGEDDDVVVQSEVGRHGLIPLRLQHQVAVIENVDASLYQVWVVERLEGVELFSALLGGTVAAQQMTAEVDTYLRYHGVTVVVFCRSYLYAGDEVLLTVGSQLSDGQLRPREDNGLGEVLQHVGEGRGGIGHRVRTMQYHKAIVVVVVVADDVAQVCPQFRRHIAGVDGRRKLVVGNLRVELVQFGNVLQQVLKVERLQSSCLRIAVHADGSASVYKQYFTLHVAKIQIKNER